MAQRHLITAESVGLFTRHGPQTHLPSDWAWSKVPNPDQWRIDLGHQLRLEVGPDEAASVVRRAWTTAAS